MRDEDEDQEDDEEGDEDNEGEDRQLGGAEASVANPDKYQDDYKENMIARGIQSNAGPKRSREQPSSASKSSHTQASPSDSRRAPHTQASDRSHPQSAKTQTASTSRTSLPLQPTDRDIREADKIAAAEEARNQPKDVRPSKSTAQSSAIGKKLRKKREERIQSSGEDTDADDDHVRDGYKPGSTDTLSFRLNVVTN